jgi:hypothetical protein
MRRVYFLVSLAIMVAILPTCKSSESPDNEPAKAANVIMQEGPIFVDGYTIFSYKGTVKNTGTANAGFTKIYIYLRRSDNSLIDQDYTYADDVDLAPGETAPWEIIFLDDGGAIRAAMDKSKTTYEIKWD